MKHWNILCIFIGMYFSFEIPDKKATFECK